MTTEERDFRLALEYDKEAVRQTPLFAAVNHMLENIYELSYVVGDRTFDPHTEPKTYLTSNEVKIFLAKISPGSITKHTQINQLIETLKTQLEQSPESMKGLISRHEFSATNKIVLTILIIGKGSRDTDRNLLTLQIDRDTKDKREIFEITSSSSQGEVDGDKDTRVEIDKYEPILIGLKEILESRKRLVGYLEV